MLDEILPELEPELERIAAARLRDERGCSLSTHDLINEAMIKIMGFRKVELKDRAHVLAWSSKLMRQVLVDHARRKRADKRAHIPVTLHTSLAQDPPIELLELDDLLRRLAEHDPERAQLVEMRFFGGMTIEDIALAMDLSEPTIKRRWAATRIWLEKRLSHA
ncbi:ECF-type sigma factor [Qipengyuania sp. JC766]|uniref:ECF-type sigma factor n=1 Tax=Qipengyuania sp. JC766 TaxID=3232139 RepID=UPI00345A2CAF